MTETKNNFNKNSVLKKIRSKYIRKIILNNLKQINLLKIFNYNKENQRLMHIELIDYEIESLKIKIEIILKENTFGKFINSIDNTQIYFNDNEKEIKKIAITKKDNVTKIKIIINQEIMSLSRLFLECKCIKKIKFIQFNRKDINDMSCMFSRCSSLEEIDLSHFNTDSSNDMGWMFEGCSSLKKLNLSNFNTYNVTDMHSMFRDCSALKELNLLKFNTINVKYMNSMFEGCSSLKELNLSNFNTNKEIDLSNMFKGCSSNLSLICSDYFIKKEYEKLFKL